MEQPNILQRDPTLIVDRLKVISQKDAEQIAAVCWQELVELLLARIILQRELPELFEPYGITRTRKIISYLLDNYHRKAHRSPQVYFAGQKAQAPFQYKDLIEKLGLWPFLN